MRSAGINPAARRDSPPADLMPVWWFVMVAGAGMRSAVAKSCRDTKALPADLMSL